MPTQIPMLTLLRNVCHAPRLGSGAPSPPGSMRCQCMSNIKNDRNCRSPVLRWDQRSGIGRDPLLFYHVDHDRRCHLRDLCGANVGPPGASYVVTPSQWRFDHPQSAAEEEVNDNRRI
ncbi:hypothetical protein M404DRAFT_388872 [Pisolithus tinctorius Marx 270]|uniref:Uncharacterized protein n=1 Tax=Pisolithus tinctorius Marx 270 TaxID=870435 RepID=A0A0C3JER6_PISTI|nr:hypothetical protein M404DRAFT_388872 [Pisolithus tinctorius Marx 270]